MQAGLGPPGRSDRTSAPSAATCKIAGNCSGDKNNEKILDRLTQAVVMKIKIVYEHGRFRFITVDKGN